MSKTYILDVDGERKFACSKKKIEDEEAVKIMIGLDFDEEALKNFVL